MIFEMRNASLHPEPVRAACVAARPLRVWPHAAHHLAARRRTSVRAPRIFSGYLGYGMLVWDALVLLAPSFGTGCVCRLRNKSQSSAPGAMRPHSIAKPKSNSPSTHSAETILECHLVDDLPDALVAAPATHLLRVFPRVRGTLRYKIEPRDRGDARAGAVYIRYASALGLVERWAMAPLEQPVRVYPALRQGEDQEIFLARGRQIELQLRRARERGLGRDFESLREYLEGDDLATSAGRRLRAAANWSRAATRPSAARPSGSCSTPAVCCAAAFCLRAKSTAHGIWATPSSTTPAPPP